MKIITFCLLQFIALNNALLSQAKEENIGTIIYNKSFSRHFAVLMQDTSLSGNRFDTWWDAPKMDKSWQDKKLFTLPAFTIDSLMFLRCEKKILELDSSVSFYNYDGLRNKSGKLKKSIKKFIRLYIGYIDASGHKKVVVQFVKPKEYKRMEHIYSKELFLLSNYKKLRFAIIEPGI